MRLCTTLAFAFLLAGASASSVQSQRPGQGDRARFVGTWRLFSFQSDSQLMAIRGQRPTGLLIYDATGHMAVQMQPEQPRPSWPMTQLPTAEQALGAATGYAAYFGTYRVDEKARTVTHHREGALNFNVVEYTRRYEFDANGRLVFFPYERAGTRIVWERVK